MAVQSNNSAILLAAGSSRRMNDGQNKVLQTLGGIHVLAHSLKTLEKSDQISRVVVVGREQDQEALEAIIEAHSTKALENFTIGGAERFDSVRNGLESLVDVKPDGVLIHDSARPFLRAEFIEHSLDALAHAEGCIIGVPLKDTLKEVDRENRITQTHNRERFWLAQTPQTFRYADILKAYRACAPPPYPTDDGAVLEAAGGRVVMELGSYHNMKLTTPEDWALAESILSLG